MYILQIRSWKSDMYYKKNNGATSYSTIII